MLIFDAHLDLAMNAIDINRDLRLSLEELRRREIGKTDFTERTHNVVSFPEMRAGHIGLCVATQIARYLRPGHLSGWHSPEQAWAQTQAQLAWYRAMEEDGQMVSICTRTELETQLALWQSPAANQPIGYILSLEGADSLVTLNHLERAHAYGLRAVGPAHYGPGVYAYGTDATEGLTPRGRELLVEMDRLKMILDATHLCDNAFWEALKIFRGPVWASHNNCRAIVPHNRQFSDEQIKALIERGSVIGAAFDAWMIIPNWIRRESTPANTGLKLEHLVAHIDHICQIAGNANHVGIGSDLDGGFGFEQTPQDLTRISELQKLIPLLQSRGYKDNEIRAIMHGNFLNFLRRALPN